MTPGCYWKRRSGCGSASIQDYTIEAFLHHL
ncbi:hypothetical protein GBAR_LOCUS27637 [Geodia barretti]|uniref:Uncharacterized protein n=1 Tax=Geodia barretti TaxID=519541 RepID=A0AA35XFB9_GEOBA|nr:hypothetical protein GBAR_LOCUS27637 [Geodia barretti]